MREPQGWAFGRNLAVLVLTMVIGAPSAAMAQACAPATHTRMTIRNVSPGLAAADPRAQPRTIWRQGSKLLRSEEAPDLTKGGAALLVIIAEPDIWTINLSARRGGHALDPGPDLYVQAPILPPAADLPPLFRALEFGCEAAFVAAHATQPTQSVPWGTTTVVAHGVTVGDYALSFLMDSRRSEPVMINLAKAGSPVFAIRYDAYRNDLPDRPDLFIPPKNVQITNAQGLAGP